MHLVRDRGRDFLYIYFRLLISKKKHLHLKFWSCKPKLQSIMLSSGPVYKLGDNMRGRGGGQGMIMFHLKVEEFLKKNYRQKGRGRRGVKIEEFLIK